MVNLGDRYWCANCGKKYVTMTASFKCKCKKKPKGEKWMDKTKDEIIEMKGL